MDILQAIGNTSMVRLRRIVPSGCADIFVKLEWETPSRADGAARPGKILVPSRRRLPVPGTFPGLTPESIVWMSTDNREFVYLRPAVSSKLILIQNLR